MAGSRYSRGSLDDQLPVTVENAARDDEEGVSSLSHHFAKARS
jgi:hypothetical protein